MRRLNRDAPRRYGVAAKDSFCTDGCLPNEMSAEWTGDVEDSFSKAKTIAYTLAGFKSAHWDGETYSSETEQRGGGHRFRCAGVVLLEQGGDGRWKEVWTGKDWVTGPQPGCPDSPPQSTVSG